MIRHRFRVTGTVSPDLPLRVLNLFAQQDLAFDRVTVEREGDRYILTVDHAALTEVKATIIAEKIAMMVLVDGVELDAIAANVAQ